MLKKFLEIVKTSIDFFREENYDGILARTPTKGKTMKKEMWVNPVAELPSDYHGWYVSLWTGYRWEFFAGPFNTKLAAEESVAHWECEHGTPNRIKWNYELLLAVKQLDVTKSKLRKTKGGRS